MDDMFVIVTNKLNKNQITIISVMFFSKFQVPQLIFLSCLLAAIIIGNTCVLAAISLSDNGRKTRMNFFIMHLAIAGKYI